MRVSAESADDNPLKRFFDTTDGRLIHKWLHYFDIYHNHFDRFREAGRPIRLLEIGVAQGGSLEMWKDYFGPTAEIWGVDISPACEKFADDQVRIRIGDQADPAFLRRLADEIGEIDIVIDDGGHQMEQQHTTFDVLYPRVHEDGVYLVEDLHTSYWYGWKAGPQVAYSFIERVKGFIDALHAYHSRSPDFSPNDLTRSLGGLHVYDSVVVLEKAARPTPPTDARAGGDSGQRVVPTADWRR